jgi:hypothetical protein
MAPVTSPRAARHRELQGRPGPPNTGHVLGEYVRVGRVHAPNDPQVMEAHATAAGNVFANLEALLERSRPEPHRERVPGIPPNSTAHGPTLS